MRNASNGIRRTVIHEAMWPCDLPLDELDMDWLRRQFSTLFDEAALAVSRAGYDLDDVVFDRYIACGHNRSDPVDMPLPSLTDADAIASAVLELLTSDGNDSSPPTGPRIAGLRVVVILERWKG